MPLASRANHPLPSASAGDQFLYAIAVQIERGSLAGKLRALSVKVHHDGGQTCCRREKTRLCASVVSRFMVRLSEKETSAPDFKVTVPSACERGCLRFRVHFLAGIGDSPGCVRRRVRRGGSARGETPRPDDGHLVTCQVFVKPGHQESLGIQPVRRVP